jgi:Bromodomain
MEAFVADMDLMFNNAKLYNADESQIFEDAVTLQVNDFREFFLLTVEHS